MATKKVKRRRLGAPAFALVTNRARKIKVDTVCVDRESIEFLCADDIASGKGKIMRVRVMLERDARKEG